MIFFLLLLPPSCTVSTTVSFVAPPLCLRLRFEDFLEVFLDFFFEDFLDFFLDCFLLDFFLDFFFEDFLDFFFEDFFLLLLPPSCAVSTTVSFVAPPLCLRLRFEDFLEVFLDFFLKIFLIFFLIVFF